MGGRPVWLVSMSRRNGAGRPRPSAEWTPAERADGLRRLRGVLDGVGDPRRERFFRMPLTFCLHRAVSDAELARLPRHTPVHLAGGPLEVLWESERGAPSTRPCAAPRMVEALPGSGIMLPADCGACPTCLARREATGYGSETRSEHRGD